MSTTNPFKQLREAAEAVLSEVDGVRKVQGLYNGEDWTALVSIAARDGASVWTRVTHADPRGQGPQTCDCSDIFLHVIIAAGATADRALAAANAEQITWDCYYAALKQTKLSLAWLHTKLLFNGIVTEHQTPSCTVCSLVMKTSADIADWSA